MANSPTLKVEIAFASAPLATSPTWTDVSQYVRANSSGGGGVTIHRGKGPEIGPFQAGYCKVTLSNRDRRFDPSYAAGPNFGNLIPRKQIRITATWAAVDYVQFTGWVNGWPQGFSDQGKDATVTIEAIDALAWLANNNLPTDLVYPYAATTIGSLAYFLRGADITNWNDATDNGYNAHVLVAQLNSAGTGRVAASLAPGMTSSAVGFDGSTVWEPNKPFTPAGNWSYSFWFQTTNLASMYILGGSIPAAQSGVSITAAGLITVTFLGASTQFSSSPLNNGVPHHVVVTAHSVNGINVYIDGLVSPTAAMTFGAIPLNVIGLYDYGGVTTFFNGSVQDVAVFNKQLSAAEVAGLYGRSSGFMPETSANRVTRLLDEVGWPATWRAITTNPRATVGELVYNGSAALPKLQEVERSEQGKLFADKSGNVAFRERYYTSEVTVGAVAQQIFSDDGGATAAPYSTFQFQFNDLDVTNSATVTTPTTRAASSDAASITANGLQSKQVDTILSTFDQADSMAAGLVAKGKTATYRVAPITVYPSKNTTRWDEILTLELGYRVSMEITPMAVGSQNVQDVTLEQIEWSIVDTLWTLTVAGSPVPSTSAGTGNGWFIIGTSLIGSTTDLIGY